MWHGCLVLPALGMIASLIAGPDPIVVRSRTFELEYAVNAAALPLDVVELWVSTDDGNSWTMYDTDNDRQSPMRVQAPGEGTFAFFVVLTNRTGDSSGRPTPGTVPHATVLVDTSPPVVQVHSIRQTVVLGRATLQIQWSAVDSNFGARPVEITYRRPMGGDWQPLTTKAIANTGRYDWAIPDGWEGSIEVRVAVRDRGGHRVEAEPLMVEILPTDATTSAGNAESEHAVAGGPVREAVPTLVADRAARLVSAGLEHRDRGEFSLGIARLREAVRLNPRLVDAWSEMAMMLYTIGDHDKALDSFEIALKQSPRHRAALRGSAMVLRRQNDYPGAAARLRELLSHDPDDAETWMSLGDVAIFQGNEILARESYQRALEVDPNAGRIVEDARKRLELMTEISKGYSNQ